LVINLGLKSVRAILFDERAQKVAVASRPVQTFLRDSWMEQDPEEWWDKTVVTVREVLETLERREVSFITVTTSAACLVPVSGTGVALRRAIMVGDRRAVAEAQSLAKLPSFASATVINSSFVADAYFMMPKAIWLLRHEPQVCHEARWLMAPGDLLNLRLTGVAVTDPLNAEKFFYDATHECYPTALLDEAGLTAEKLAPVAALGERIGSLTREAASVLGLSSQTPVILSTYDALCAFWGSGVCREGDVADVSGTVTSVRVLSKRPLEAKERRIFSQTLPGSGYHVIGGSNNLGGGLIEWLKQSFYGHDDRPYELMESEAEQSGPCARGIVFLPYLLGERCPIWDPDARGVLFGLERQHRRGDFARAVLESAAFSLEHILQTVREHHIRPERLRVSGGLARLRLMGLIKADVTGLPTEVLEEFETASLGAFLIAGTGVGLFRNLVDASGLVSVREVILPNRERHQVYQDWLGLYLRLYERSRALFAERHDLFEKHGLRGLERLENL